MQKFDNIHNDLINIIKEKIKEELSINVDFNNAMIEIYDENYRTMSYHTDQALDLVDDSYICIFSIYSNPLGNLRKLFIKNKKDNSTKNILLDNNSIVFFSTDTNKQFLHKISLEKSTTDNMWLGITLRLSKTFIKKINEKIYINDKILTMATDEEKIAFRCFKRLENETCDFIYPEITYTTNPMDLIIS